MAAGREDAPHAAVLWVRYEVHERLPTGELRGTPAEQGTRVFQVQGADRHICVRRLHEILKGLADAGPANQAE